MKKFLFFTLLCAMVCFDSCKDDDDDQPSIDLLKPSVAFEPGGYAVELGKSVQIIPVVTNKENCTYSWKTDGREISIGDTLNFTPAEVKTYSIALTVTNPYGSAEATCSVNVSEPVSLYKDAVLIQDIGARGDGGQDPNWGQLYCINSAGELLGDVFREINDKTLGAACTPLCRLGNKIYIIADQGVEDRNKAELTVINAETMQCEKTSAVELPGITSTVRGLYVFSETEAYVSMSGNKLYKFDLEIEKTTGEINVPSNFSTGSKLPLIKSNGKIYGICSGMMNSKICSINPETNEVTSTDITGQIGALLQKDDKTLLIVAIDFMSDKGSIIEFSTETNTVVGEPQIMGPKVATQSSFVKVPGEDVIYFNGANNDRITIYKYNYQTKTLETFAVITDEMEKITAMNLNPVDHKLYFSYKLALGVSNWRTAVFDSKSACPATPLGDGYAYKALTVGLIDFNVL